MKGGCRNAPGLGAVAQEALGKKNDGHHVLHGELTCVECFLEAVRRGVGGHHHDGTFSVAAVEGLIEVGLLSLGRDTGGRTAALHVHEDEGQLGDHGQTEGLGLQGETGVLALSSL